MVEGSTPLIGGEAQSSCRICPSVDSTSNSNNNNSVIKSQVDTKLPDVMDLAQVAQYLSVFESEVVDLLESKRLKGQLIGTKWRIARTAVDKFLNCE